MDSIKVVIVHYRALLVEDETVTSSILMHSLPTVVWLKTKYYVFEGFFLARLHVSSRQSQRRVRPLSLDERPYSKGFAFPS